MVLPDMRTALLIDAHTTLRFLDVFGFPTP
jgi:hypothetical protein